MPDRDGDSSGAIAIDFEPRRPPPLNVNFDDTLDIDYFLYRDPFLASAFPICYALASATTMAWMLLLALFTMHRVLLDGRIVYLGRWSFKNGSGGLSRGEWPWLQKISVFFVAVTLTVASVDTFHIAKSQYAWGIQNAALLQMAVMSGTNIKVVGLVADTTLWLAQAQTLIRLFPRHRDQVLTKWAAFILIALDTLSSALNSFMAVTNSHGNARPRTFSEPISTLSYLMHLALGLTYAGWVLYYAFMKRKYAFYHSGMKNMCLLAAISLAAVLTPVGFFIVDIYDPNAVGWSEYVRWAAAASASVVVWEWVERIEELEWEERKNGVLGREVIDGDDDDDALELGALEMPWPKRKTGRRNGDGDGDGDGDCNSGHDPDDNNNKQQQSQQPGGRQAGPYRLWPGVASISTGGGGAWRGRITVDRTASLDGGRRRRQESAPEHHHCDGGTGETSTFTPPTWPSPVPTSVHRTDRPSTEYTMRFQPTASTARTPDRLFPTRTAQTAASPPPPPLSSSSLSDAGPSRAGRWSRMLFGQIEGSPWDQPSRPVPREATSRWDLRLRIEEFAADRVERMRDRMRPPPSMVDSLPVVVIPAPPRDGDALQRVLEEAEFASESWDGVAMNRLASSSAGLVREDTLTTKTTTTTRRRRRSLPDADLCLGGQTVGDRS